MTALCLRGEREWLQAPARPPRFALESADALAFISSNAATLGEAALTCHDLDELLRAAIFQTAALSAARLGTLVEPRFTGLAPFLATGPPPSSGIMMLEYVSHAAIADIRRLAAPAALGSAVLSRGVEEHAGFSTQSARASTDVVAAYRVVLACELVAAVRALRLRGIRPAPGPLAEAFELATGTLPADTADRPLDGDLAQADRLLPALSAVAREASSAAGG